MPQKRNPISCAYITACSALVRQHAAALLNAMDAEFERATGTWEIEWLVLPEAFCYTAGALGQARFMLSGLVVHPEAMRENLQRTHGLVNTEAVMMALAPSLGREVAHDALSKVAIRVAGGEGQLVDLLAADDRISAHFDRDALERLLDPTNYLGLSTTFVDRALSAHAQTSSSHPVRRGA